MRINVVKNQVFLVQKPCDLLPTYLAMKLFAQEVCTRKSLSIIYCCYNINLTDINTALSKA